MVVVVGVGHLPPVKCPHHLSKLNAPSWSLATLVKAHAKLPIQILAAYPYLAAGYRNGDHCDMRDAAGIDSLVWDLTKGESDRKGAFDWSR